MDLASLKPTADELLSAVGLSQAQLPKHIAVIMDGNGRWAEKQGLPRIEGHRRGVTSVRNMVEECSRFELGQLTLYCLSSENWKRPRRELDFLLSLLEQYVIEERQEILRQNIRFCMIGRREGLTEGVLREVERTVEQSANNTGMRLCLAVNYGSRQEIVDAVQRISTDVSSGALTPSQIDEGLISQYLYTAGMEDPDLVIRTAGEMRLSNFLLWQISYAELWVTETHWPEFRRPDLIEALKSFAARVRRYGGLKG